VLILRSFVVNILPFYNGQNYELFIDNQLQFFEVLSNWLMMVRRLYWFEKNL